MRGLVIFLGLLLLLAGGALAGAQFAHIDLSFLDQLPVAGAKSFAQSQMALYAGGGAAAVGLLLMIVGMAGGGKKKEKPAPRRASAEPARASAPPQASRDPDPVKPRAPEPVKARTPEPPREQPKPELPRTARAPEPPKPTPRPVAAAPAAAPPPMPPKPEPRQEPRPQAKPQASAQPPDGVAAEAAAASARAADPRLFNRQRVRDLVSLNDAIKAYHAKTGAYPVAKEAGGFLERGKNWIPGLSPDFIAELPRDPAMSNEKTGPQYVYVSDGSDYKLLASAVSMVGASTNVEVLGVKFDPSKNNTLESASFGFWTTAFEGA